MFLIYPIISKTKSSKSGVIFNWQKSLIHCFKSRNTKKISKEAVTVSVSGGDKIIEMDRMA